MCSRLGPPPAEVTAALPMAKHHPDLIMCRKQPGISVGRLCEKCDGKCPICDSYVRPNTLVRICDECNYGSFQGRCIICGGPGISDAYYCKECTQQEKDRDGCPKARRRRAFPPRGASPAPTSPPRRGCPACCQLGAPSSAAAALSLPSAALLPSLAAAAALTAAPPHPNGRLPAPAVQIVNLGSSKTDLFYERKKYGFKKR